MRINSKYFPTYIISRYHTDGLVVTYGYINIKIFKVMYGLKQASIIAYNQLIFHMETHGYYPVPFTTVIWAQKTSRTKRFLCVDDFVVKFFSKYYANHLLDYLKKHYVISTYWEGFNYLGLTIDWNHSE